MKSLSFNNIWQLVRYYWRTEKKLYLRLYLGLIALYLFVWLIVIIFQRILSIDQFAGFYMVLNDEWIFWGFILICTARMFAALEKKQTAITLLTLPISNRTKFLTRVIYATIGIYLLALIARCTANTLTSIPLFFDDKWPLEYILRYRIFPGHWNIASFNATGTNTIFDAFAIIMFAIAFALWPWSLFTLFGLLFRRHGWLWAIPVLFVGITLFAVVMTNLHFSDDVEITIILVTIFAFSLLNYWLAYRCFCHAQVISNKLTRL